MNDIKGIRGFYLDTMNTTGAETQVKRVGPHIVTRDISGRGWGIDRFHPVVLGICREAIAEIYLSRARGTIRATLDIATHRVHLEQARLDQALSAYPGMLLTRRNMNPPTRRLIRRLIEETPAFDRDVARFGLQAARAKFRFHRGTLPDEAMAPTGNTCVLCTRKFTRNGIKFARLVYNSQAFQNLRFQKGADLSVNVAVDEENLGRIWVILNDGQILQGLALRKEYAEGLSIHQHQEIQKYRRRNNLPDNEEGWVEAKKQIFRLLEYRVKGSNGPQ